ncbi:aldose 1-epimerase family protein [Altererythrobacter xixiisoli]|uniref:Aldose 1-epimerase family protein n=1 Tax=Croceibacterium xixiisoli TaxID=1476466 RepID=A0A6I4U0F8_9SPHN|nr:aldose 1-epimerase family protein [Croceibacterium xixiisoli]MXP00134.1 aldose 1-epimerase family protein [Croceibacterium xixiisoli]
MSNALGTFVEIASAGLTAQIELFGAELFSLTDAVGREYMTDADPTWWTGHAPILFPIVGGLAGGRFRHEGQEYTLSRHGFARGRAFDVVERAGDSVTLRLVDNADSRAAYPFPFVLDMRFTLAGMVLSMEARVSNPGDGPLPFSFGYHPAFAWPLPDGGAKDEHQIVFAQDEPQPVRRLDAAGLVALEEPTPVRDRVLALASGLFEADALIWDRLASRDLSYRSPAGARLDISFPELPMLGIWQKPGARFICIEPWAGIADPAGFAGTLSEKPGIMLLEPGAERSFCMDVAVHPAD